MGLRAKLEELKNKPYYEVVQSVDGYIEEYKQAKKNAPEKSEDKDEKTKAYFYLLIDWLEERFPEGKYRDVIGLCKVAKIDGEDGIKEQDWSLNAGRYVGVVIEDDGLTPEEFKTQMLELNAELETLNQEAQKLEKEIAQNITGLFGE